MIRVLVIEDGTEYIDALGRFLTEGFQFDRAGSGPAGLSALRDRPYDAILLDMRFDRAPEAELLGNVEEIADRFNGDTVQARRFLEDHQGTYILAALRDAGIVTPVLLSYDFSGEPRRWERLAARSGPVAYVGDGASPLAVGEQLRAMAEPGRSP